MAKDKLGPWDAAAFDTLERWDPAWCAIVDKMTNSPWSGVLDHKTVELISVAINAACTNLNPDGTRRHVRNALAAGATRDELLQVLKMASLMAIHSCSLGAPILLEEAQAASVTPTGIPTRSQLPPVTRCGPRASGTTLGIHFLNLIPFGPTSSWRPESLYMEMA